MRGGEGEGEGERGGGEGRREGQPLLGDLDTINILTEQHKVGGGEGRGRGEGEGGAAPYWGTWTRSTSSRAKQVI